jgi:hypothetical protein
MPDKDWPFAIGGGPFFLASPGTIPASLWLFYNHRYDVMR